MLIHPHLTGPAALDRHGDLMVAAQRRRLVHQATHERVGPPRGRRRRRST